MSAGSERDSVARPLRGVVIKGLLLFALVLLAVVVVVLATGDDLLPMAYEGFN